MRYDFEDALKAFKQDKIADLADDPSGLRFLLLRSLARKDYLNEVAASAGVKTEEIPNNDLLRRVFESKQISVAHVKSQIASIYERERAVRRKREHHLLNELYLVKEFDWGGLHQNNLEKSIVDNYVKKIHTYDLLCDSIDSKLYPSMRSYVLCSWYNHWTSIIVEDIFKDHRRVLPAVGLVKKMDFFVDDVPFDLKVTYLPEGYVKDRRKEENVRPEATLLKRVCRKFDVPIPSYMPESRLLENLWEMMQDHPSQDAQETISELRKFRDKLLEEVVHEPLRLIKWLYENQGSRRFDSANRLFLVLVNTSNYFDSWKLKRSRDFLVQAIHQALDQFQEGEVDKLRFSWRGESYVTNSRAIIVTK